MSRLSFRMKRVQNMEYLPFTFMGLAFLIWMQMMRINRHDLSSLTARRLSESTELLPQTPEETQLEESIASFAVLLLMFMEGVAFLIGYALKQAHFKYLQEAGATMLFGAIVGGFIRFLSNIDKLKSVVTLDAQFFFLFLLPPIIFESGYNMKRGNFFKNFGGIIMFALVGTTIATFITGGLLYLIVKAGIMSHELGFLDCLIFGSLISATDPVTVLAIFKELRVDLDLYSNVFGESVLNDAVAIVLYRTLVNFRQAELSAYNVFYAFGQFFKIFLGSVFCGVVVALLSALLYKHTQLNKYPTLEITLLLLFAYASYLLAEGLFLSGIVAILFCGIIIAHYTYNNLSSESKNLSVKIFEVLSSLAETLVFAYLGLALFSFDSEYDPAFIVFGIIIILFARASHVFPLSFFINLTRPTWRKINLNHQVFIWFAGLRGAIAFILALSLQNEAIKSATAILTTTLVIDFFTVLVLGGATIPLLEKLKIPIGVSKEEEGEHVHTKDSSFFLRVDRSYLKPFFTKVPYRVWRPQGLDPEADIELSDIPAPYTRQPQDDSDSHSNPSAQLEVEEIEVQQE